MIKYEMVKDKLEEILMDKRISKIDGILVVTDEVGYKGDDQVFPLHPENKFYLDQISDDKIRNAYVLEIGWGSGILSIGAIRKGAKEVVGLEINPRAKNYAGFNILLNGVEGRVSIRDGNQEEIFSPVRGEKFDYIISNPPFEPTPNNIDYYIHSSGGSYGLDFVKKIFRELNDYMTDRGHAQIVSFSPGNKAGPFMLKNLIKEYLPGKTNLIVERNPIRFNDFVERFVEIGKATSEQIKLMKERARQDKVSHLYLCMVHYEKGCNVLETVWCTKDYSNWDLPLNSKIPMGGRKK